MQFNLKCDLILLLEGNGLQVCVLIELGSLKVDQIQREINNLYFILAINYF